MIKVFFSYSHKDETNRNELEKHLAVLRRQNVIETWHDRRIVVGADLGNEIDQNLAESNLILLLVSPDFIASDYCYSVEMAKALEMRHQGMAWVMPIILDHCDWQNTPLKDLLACPQDGNPVSDFPNPNKAFQEIVHEIRRVIQEILSVQVTIATPELQSTFGAPGIDPEPVITDRARSGNLRIKREFTDYEKDTFKEEAFEYITRFFNGKNDHGP